MNIPLRWIDALRQLHENGFPEAIIAGGALRDLDNDRPIKDVDIFVRNRGVMTKTMLEKAFGYNVRDVKIDFNVTDENGTPDGSAAQDIEEMYDLTDWSGVRLTCSFDHLNPDWTQRIYLNESEGPPKFEVIAVQVPEGDNFMTSIVDDFDIGFCKIAGELSPLDPPHLMRVIWAEYDKDKREQTLTVVRADKDGSLDRTKKRLARINDKYPEWRVVIPEEFTKPEITFEESPF
jgi:hypothetical protein